MLDANGEAVTAEVEAVFDFLLKFDENEGLDGFAFTSFGLSTGLDTFTGARDVIVSPGGTAALLSGDKVKAILHALQSEGNAKITSAPQIAAIRMAGRI